MSAIGDYIHYTAKGYNEHGITIRGSKEIVNFKAQKENIKKRLAPSGMKNKSKYQDALNKILSNKDNSDAEVQNIQAYIEQQLTDRYQETMGKINWGTGDVTAGVSAGKQATSNAIQTVGRQKGVLVSSIVSRVRALEKARNKMIDVKEKAELSKNINQIYRELNMIITNGKKIGEITNLKNLNTKTDKYKYGIIDKNSNLITTVNSLVKQYAAVPAINLQKGDLFEYAAALAPAIGKVNAQTALYDTLATGIVGGARSKVQINFGEFFTDKVNLQGLVMDNYVVHSNGTAVSYGSSQEKIDINVQWGDQIIPMSAKNVNLKSGYDVHILSGSSLLYLIQDEPANFVNHYLNIIAAHPDGTVNIAGAHEAMKYTLLFKALTGNTYGRKGASIFLVNDNSQEGGVRLYEMEDLIAKAATNINGYVSFKPALEGIRISNEWAADYGTRIAKFLSGVHAQKISVALKPSLLK